ncbi:MAG: DUF5050 domain-containing protein [Acutalibacteraceae bacterium]|nr:DUF5050 domain-containing protein [Acutalibacteraceae bacterium]
MFYRNTNDNGSLYRYNIKDDTYIKLFGENRNSFLHSITVFDEQVYFVTRTETDRSPTLYRIPINGGNAERLIENVCDDFAVTEDAIYYTGYQCPTHHGDYQLHKYTFADKKADILLDLHCYQQFNLIDNKIYCLVINDEGSAYGLAYFDIATQTTVRIDTGDADGFDNAVSANGGKIIYLNMNGFLCSYNIETKEFNEITNDFDRIAFMAAANDDLLFFTAWTNQEKKVYQYKKGIISEYTDGKLYQNDLLEVVDNKPILMSSANTNGNKIEGDSRLNVVE